MYKHYRPGSMRQWRMREWDYPDFLSRDFWRFHPSYFYLFKVKLTVQDFKILVSQTLNFPLSEILSERGFSLYFAKIWSVPITYYPILFMYCFASGSKSDTLLFRRLFQSTPSIFKIFWKIQKLRFWRKKDDFKPRLIHVFGNVCA